MLPVFVLILVGLLIAPASCQNMTLMSGQVINLPELYKANNWKCCIPRDFLGDFTPIVRLDGSGGKFFVTNDPQCKDNNQIVPSAAYPSTYQAIWACGSCKGNNCSPDGGLQLALPDDWCVDSQNRQDPNVVCSTAAPLCDAGYSGKCMAVPEANTKAISSGPSITLQSGLVVDLAQLQQQYPGQCCLPRSVLADNSAVLRMDNSDGRYFVSMDPSCSSPLTSDVYPVMFEYIAVGCPAPSSSSYSSGNTYIFNGGPTLISSGGTCDPFNVWGGSCWGPASICSFANTCIGIPSYGFDSWDDSWGYYRPRWWLPLWNPLRPGWVKPPIFNRPGPLLPIRPPPPGWRPGSPLPGWRPGNRPPSFQPIMPLRPPGGKPWPSTRPATPIHRGPGASGGAPSTRPAGRPAGPGQLLPGGNGGGSRPSIGEQPSWVSRPAANLPTTRPSMPETRPSMPTTRPSMPTTRPSTPTTRPSMPTTRPSYPTTRPSMPTTRPTTRPSMPTTRPAYVPSTRPSMPATRPAAGGLGGARGGARGGGGGGRFGRL
ncbi:hypothetical protein OEZ86_000094 [Tetradesmus obliquus]|nr:hypothetical protein OEZ86_000094 [Tetradesmus obliquus]